MTFPATVTKRNASSQDMLGMLVRTVGTDATLLIIENWAGCRVFIPKISKDGQKLATLIGVGRSQALSSEFAGMMISVPLARTWRCKIYWERGWSNPQIAKTLGISDNTVVRILSKLGLSRSHRAKSTRAEINPVMSERLVPAE